MQLYYNQLDKHLQGNLKYIYIITGDQIYQEENCVQKIIKKANENNIYDHEILYIDKSFDWDYFDSINTNLSLFSVRKVIELRFLTKTVGVNAEKRIEKYIENYNESNILIIRLPILKISDFKKNYLGIKNINVGLIRLFEFTKKNMIFELTEIATKFNYNIDKDCINYISDLYEGNMVAANQALIKINLLINKDEIINLEFLKKVFSSDVDFEAINLVDYTIEGNLDKIQSCCIFLKKNNYPAQYIIWSFIRTFRSIITNLELVSQGKPIEEILKNIWPYEKKNLMTLSMKKFSVKKIESYLGILVRIDMQSKNVLDENVWDSIYDLSVSIAKNKLSVIKYT